MIEINEVGVGGLERELILAVVWNQQRTLCGLLERNPSFRVSSSLSATLVQLVVDNESLRALLPLLDYGIVGIVEVAYEAMKKSKSLFLQAILFEKLSDSAQLRLDRIVEQHYEDFDPIIRTVIDVNSRDVCPFSLDEFDQDEDSINFRM